MPSENWGLPASAASVGSPERGWTSELALASVVGPGHQTFVGFATFVAAAILVADVVVAVVAFVAPNAHRICSTWIAAEPEAVVVRVE